MMEALDDEQPQSQPLLDPSTTTTTTTTMSSSTDRGLRRRGAGGMVASAYLQHKRHLLEMTLRRRFRRNNARDSDHAGGDEENGLMGDPAFNFQDEPSRETENQARFSLWTRVVLIVAGASLIMNILAMVGVGFVFACLLGSMISVTVGVVQLKLEDLESEYTVCWRYLCLPVVVLVCLWKI